MKKRNIIHSALSLSLTAALCLSMAACGGTQPPADSSAASAAPAQPAAVQPAAEEPTSTALPVKALHPKQVDENPYMAKSDANIHHDGYNTDSTDEILPLGIYPEINVSYEKTNANASPAIYFDSYGRTFLYFRKIAFGNVDHQFHRSDLFHYQHRVSTTIHIAIIVITSRYHTIDGAE